MLEYWQKLSKMTVTVRTLLEQLIDGMYNRKKSGNV